MPIKDLHDVEGWPATYGSHGGPEGPRAGSTWAVRALERAGFVLAGRTNAPELGPITVTENLRYGVTRNPWDLGRTPGGSSGGAAAAVAAGMFPTAHASDGGGSIRIPSSCCGLVGMKPSRGRIPDVPAGWLGMATEGALCRTVADAAAVLDCLSGPDPGAWWNAPPPPRPFAEQAAEDPPLLRVAVVEEAPFGMTVAHEPRAATRRCAELLSKAGHAVETVEPFLVDFDMLAAFQVVVRAGYGDYPDVDWSRVEPHNAEGHRAARSTSALELVDALAALQRFSHDLVSRFGRDFDILVTPTMAIEPPPAGTLLPRVHEQPDAPPEEIISMAIFTAAFNVTGQPALNVPLHRTPSNVPIGVQLVGPVWGEGLLLQVANRLEAEEPWSARRPPTSQ